MSSRLLLFSFCLLLFTPFLQGQGIHFTQFNLSPLTLNPALTGKYEGTFRVGGIARDQWRAVPNAQAYQTQSAYIDAPLFRGFRRKDWIGLGVMAFNDNVAVGKLSHTAFKISGAYHLAIDKKGQTMLTLGAQFGAESRRTTNGYRFELDVMSGDPRSSGTDPGFQNTSGDISDNFNNWTAGVVFSSKMSKTNDIQIGFSMANLARPQYTLLSGNSGTGTGSLPARLARRGIFHGTFNTKLDKKWTLSPSFLLQTTASQSEIIIQGLAGYLWDAKRDLTLNAGLSYRLADAVSPMIGAKYKKLTLGLAYDIRTGQILNKVNNGRGGIEIAAYYIQKIYKQPKVKTKILCPRF
jgi:type IX secretion system PorP/SprF family membrane protein